MTTHSWRRLGVVTALLLGSLSSLQAQCLPIDELTPGITGGYGGSVGVSGDHAAIGAPLAFQNNVLTGAVYVWTHDGFTWVLEPEVLASDSAQDDFFGTKVAIDGDVLAVSAPGDDDQGSGSGSVYVYRFDGSAWIQEAKLLQPGGSASLGYGGKHLALDGDVLLVSFPDGVDVWRFAGVFIGWQFEQSITGQTFFAENFDVSGDRLTIGSRGEALGGAAYLYEYDGVSQWNQTDRLTGSDTASGDRFGAQVGLDGSMLAVGDPEDGSNGSLYLFEDQGGAWTETARLFPSVAVRNFGTILVLDGTTVVVAGDNREAVFEFRRVRGTWVEATVYDEPALTRFGTALAVDGERAIIGSGNERAFEFPATRLRLVSDDLTPDPGDVINLRTTPGLPGKPLTLFVMEVNGTPFRYRLLSFKFGTDYSFTIQATVPSGLSGNVVGLQSFALGAGGAIEESNLLNIDFQ